MTSRKEKVRTEQFDLMIDGKSLNIQASKYMSASNEARFRVCINDSPLYIFGYNSQLGKVVAMDKATVGNELTPKIEEAIGMRLSKAA